MVHGWAGSVSDFVSHVALPSALGDSHREHYGQWPSEAQSAAWQLSLRYLAAALATLRPACDGWSVILEYELPLEGGRRPDAIVLAGNAIIVLEFKESLDRSWADVAQVDAYARDLAEYHSASRDLRVSPLLVYVQRGGLEEAFEGVPVIGPDRLAPYLRQHAGHGPQIDLGAWLRGHYAPLPSLVQAARQIFQHGSLPAIRTAESAGIPETLVYLHDVVARARRERGHHLVLLTGVPGSGKTLVGLQFVYDSATEQEPRATWYSGNDPLVTVLQDALGGARVAKGFVNRWHNFDLEFGIRGSQHPNSVMVFDEAQRAWDAERMSLKKGVHKSEPHVALEVATRLDWSVVVGLIGEGQEIYLGEEAGIGQWAEAARAAPARYVVHAPEHLRPELPVATLEVAPELNLTSSLRSHRAAHSHEWTRRVLDGDLHGARQLAETLFELQYPIWVTDNLSAVRQGLARRYESEPTKRYGLVASSKARNLQSLGVDNEFYAMQRLPLAAWFNAPPADPRSSCQLRTPTTEFQCQGLELDLPVLCWGDDLAWEDGWVNLRRQRDAKDARALRLNTYRVLMSRGRDGLIVWVPPNLPSGQSRRVTSVLEEAGARPLPD